MIQGLVAQIDAQRRRPLRLDQGNIRLWPHPGPEHPIAKVGQEGAMMGQHHRQRRLAHPRQPLRGKCRTLAIGQPRHQIGNQCFPAKEVGRQRGHIDIKRLTRPGLVDMLDKVAANKVAASGAHRAGIHGTAAGVHCLG